MKNLAFAMLLLCLLVTTGMNAQIGTHAAKLGFEPMSFDWTNADLRSVFMLNASDGWAVGQGGTILHWNGAAWRTVPSPTGITLISVFMLNATDGWAVGDGGVIIHWNGTAWNEVVSPTSETLYGVFMVNATDGWAVGGTPGGSPSAVILRWNGTAWNKVSSPMSNWLRSVFMVNATDGWAVSGAYGIIRWNGTVWKSIASPTSSGFNSVFMVNATEGWATCFNGQIINWNGTSWSNFTKPTSQSLRSVFMLNATDGWIVGDSDILHWNGTTWNNVTKPAPNWLFSVFMVNATEGWAVGDFGLILRWNGTEWTISKSPIYQGDLYLSDSDVYVIEGVFNINGSIIVEENATLILKNAIVNFTQTSDWQRNMTFENPLEGNPRLQATNVTITSNYKYSIDLYSGSSANVSDSQFVGSSEAYCWLGVYGASSSAYFHNLTVCGISTSGCSNIFFFDSSITDLNVYSGNVSAYSSNIYVANAYGSGVISMDKCTVYALQTFDQSQQYVSNSTITRIRAHNETLVWLVNSTFTEHLLYNQSRVFVFWYLNVHVIDKLSQDVPSANVTATYPNATAAESMLTDLNGWARLTLMEKMMNATGEYPVGNYTLTATYEIYSNQTEVNMTGNQVVTLRLEDFVVPEFSSILILPMLITTALLAFVIRRRKPAHASKP